MKEWTELVNRAQSGDLDAFGQIVRRFQDMAVGYAYSILDDFHLAEDAAQEAFVACYQELPNLREPEAFPAWFRRIVFTHCNRMTRSKRVPIVSLEDAGHMITGEQDPVRVAERRVLTEKVLEVIGALPDEERAVTTLCCINGYSQAEVGAFLDMPLSTIKNRLHSARAKLREGMMEMVEETLRGIAPGSEFTRKVADAVSQKRSLNEFLDGFPVLETKRLRLREFRPEEDAAHWVTLAQVPEDTPDCDFAGKSESQLVRRMQRFRDNFYKPVVVPFWAIALKDNDAIIGNVRYWHWDGWEKAPWSFGYIQYELAAPYWDKGYGPEALRAAGEFGIRQFGLARVVCSINVSDKARRRELKEAGYTDEGVHRDWYYDPSKKKWLDEHWFSLVKRDLAE